MQAEHQDGAGDDPEQRGSATGDGVQTGAGRCSARSDPTGAEARGYGRPPAEHRFQSGRSGNPKGRPRGATSFKRLLERELTERVPVKEGGKRRKLSRRGVIVKRLVGEAMAGSPKHLAIVLAQDPATAAVLDEVTEALARPADDLVKADLIRRLRQAATGSNPDADSAAPDEGVRSGPGGNPLA